MTKEGLEEYLAEGLSLEQIGKRVGRNPSTISYQPEEARPEAGE
jgi:IS30 family transposase